MTAAIGATIAFVASLVVIIVVAVIAWLTRERPAYTSKLGMKVYLKGCKVSQIAVELALALFVSAMQPHFRMDITAHIAKMSCHWVANPIEGRHVSQLNKVFNGMTHSEWRIEVYKNSAAIMSTAFLYEVLNACIWQECGYDIAVDEGGESRAMYDNAFKAVQ